MAIVINGSGTVTGLAVGGLPDGTVDDGTVASGIASSKLTGALPAISGASLTGFTDAQMPAGSVVQVVTATGSTETNSTATSWIATDASVTITPTSASNKIYLSHTAGGIYEQPTTNGNIGLRIRRTLDSVVSYPYSSARYHYSDSNAWIGINWAVVATDLPNSTGAATYVLEIHLQNTGGGIRHCDSSAWTFVAMEIAV